MNIQEIRELDDAGLNEELAKAEKEVFTLRMNNVIGNNDNPLAIRFRKRDIARMKTVQKERKLNIR